MSALFLLALKLRGFELRLTSDKFLGTFGLLPEVNNKFWFLAGNSL
jgi:hypothetical protein